MKTVVMKELDHAIPAGYAELLHDLKQKIRGAQFRASLAVNQELVLLYWRIGREILTRQERESWGAKVIDRLSADLKTAFPEMKGFSPRNLKYMRAFAEAWPEEAIVQRVVAQIPWGHNVRILDYVKHPSERDWYVRATLQYGWSRDILVHQIESGLYRRQGGAITDFEQVMPPAQSELAQQITKDPYCFDFLMLDPDAHERDLERALLEHLREFLLELGVGFAFVGSRYRLEVGGQEFYIDLLFYYLKLRAYVVVELKLEAFRQDEFLFVRCKRSVSPSRRPAQYRLDPLQDARPDCRRVRAAGCFETDRHFGVPPGRRAAGRAQR